MSSRLISGFYNGLLCGISSYGCYKIDPMAQPFGFASCVVACSQGLLGLVRAYNNSDKELVTISRHPTYRNILHVGQISLINWGIYKQSGCKRSSILFGLCLGPLIYCMALVPKKNIWLDLMTGINIISLLHLTRVEGNWTYFLMAYLTLLSSYGSEYMKDCGYKNFEEPITCLSLGCIVLLSIKAMT